MKIAITGASGLIGSALTAALTQSGHEVLRFVRSVPRTAQEIRWEPSKGNADALDVNALEGIDAVIHLSGAGVGDKRWSESYKREILNSRVLSTKAISAAMARAENGPKVLISASAIGYYGDTGDTAVDEHSPKGEGFLADVVQAWEASADEARNAGIRVAHPRTGLVISSKGGAWGRMLPLFKAGIGGVLGSGRQYWSFISMRDELAALEYLVKNEISGPVNLTAPSPVTNAEITRAMGRALKRPTILPVPAIALKTVLGEFSIEVLGSARVVPGVLQQHGFVFADPTIDAALASMLTTRL